MTQVWPTADPFTSGSPAFNLRGYLSAQLDDGTAYQYGRLSSAYQPAGGLATSVRDPANAATLSGNPIGQLRRELFSADVQVTADLGIRPVSGTPPADAITRHGILARVTAGTVLSKGVGSQRWNWVEDLTCYAFELRNIGSGNLRLVLSRWILGTETVLAQSDTFAASEAPWNLGHRLILAVSTVAGDVELVASVAGIPAAAITATQQNAYQPGGDGGVFTFDESLSQGPPGGGTILEVPDLIPTTQGPLGKWIKTDREVNLGGNDVVGAVEVLQFTDTSGSKITASGRCGFLMGDESEVPDAQGRRWVPACLTFEVTDITTPEEPSISWRDEWQRANPVGASLIVDAFGTPVGRDLTSDWSTDGGGAEGSFKLSSGAGDVVLQNGSISFGNSVDLDGSATERLLLEEPAQVFPPNVPGSALRVTVAVWASVHTHRDGNEFYSTFDAAVENGFGFGWRTGELDPAKQQFEVRIASGGFGTLQSFRTGEVAVAPLLNKTACFVFTWKAGHYTGGGGRLRVYVGQLGFAQLVGEFEVDAGLDPAFSTQNSHRIGEVQDSPTPTPDSSRFFDGYVDRVTVFDRELTLGEVKTVCTEATPDSVLLNLGAIHGVDFEDVTVDGSELKFDPWASAAPSDDDGRWVVDGASTETGLVSTIADSVVPMIHQRPANSDDQSRSVDVTLPVTASRAGVYLRATGVKQVAGVQTGGSGYRCIIGVGDPAGVVVERVNGNVVTRLAESTAASPVAVVAATEFSLQFTATRSNPDLPDSSVDLRVAIDGVSVPLQSVDAEVGILADAVTANDTSDERITSGAATGLLVVTPTGLAVTFDNYTVESAEGLTGAASAPEVGFPAEDANKSGDLASVFVPEWPIEILNPTGRLDSPMEDGRLHRLAQDAYERRRVRIGTKSGTAAEAAALLEFVDEHEGPVIPFDWTGGLSTLFPGEPDGVWAIRRTTLDVDSGPNGQRVVVIELEEVVQSS